MPSRSTTPEHAQQRVRSDNTDSRPGEMQGTIEQWATDLLELEAPGEWRSGVLDKSDVDDT